MTDLLAVAILTGYSLACAVAGWLLHRGAHHGRWWLEALYHRSRATHAEHRATHTEKLLRTAQDQCEISQHVYLTHLSHCPLAQHTDHGDAA